MLIEQNFQSLDDDVKITRLNDFFKKQYEISKLSNNDDIQFQYEILMELKNCLHTRFGKFVIVDYDKKQFVDCCDDLITAISKIYDLDIQKESFIYEMPSAV